MLRDYRGELLQTTYETACSDLTVNLQDDIVLLSYFPVSEVSLQKEKLQQRPWA